MQTNVAFSSVTLQQATAWLVKLAPARLKIGAVVFVGDWNPHSRRFVIAALTPQRNVPEAPLPDITEGTLTIPLSTSPDSLVKAFRSFGARVERRQRDLENRFDFVGDSAGVGHTVHAHHHVAVCGSKGPWTHGLVPSAACEKCASVAATTPKHRVRYSPPQTS